jgi:hypothetical protein
VRDAGRLLAHPDDFLQYSLGAYIYAGGNPVEPETVGVRPGVAIESGKSYCPLSWEPRPPTS